jgi:hypothetical protein
MIDFFPDYYSSALAKATELGIRAIIMSSLTRYKLHTVSVPLRLL